MHTAAQEPHTAPKKVMFLITKATWGGAQRYVYDLATHLPDAMVSVAYGTTGRLSEKLLESGVETHHIASLGRDVAALADMRSYVEIAALLKKERPDVLHLNSSKAAALGALGARFAGVPRIVFTAHGWPFKESRDPLSKAIIFLVSYITALLSHIVIVVSKEDEMSTRHMPLVVKKVHYIPLGADVEDPLPRADAESMLSIKASSSKRVVTIGELTKNKGITYGIDAIATLVGSGIDVEYYVIGNGEDRERLEKQVVEARLTHRVHFLGFIPDASRYLLAFDAYLLPSLKEGMPYVLIEAGGAGLPAVVVKGVVNSDLIAHITTIREAPSHRDIANTLATAMCGKRSAPLIPLFDLHSMIEATDALYY